jgi:GT2 family glycosyltransferase
MLTQLFLYPEADLPSSLPEDVRAACLPRRPSEAARAITAALNDPAIEVLAFWDPRHAPIPWLQLARFAASLDDAWHPGQRLSGPDDDLLLQYVMPFWVNRPSPAADVAGGVNWRLDLRACFVRADVVRKLGLDGAYETLAGMARALGLAMIRRGAVCRQQPALWSGAAIPEPPSASDRYRLVLQATSKQWRTYALLRSVLDGRSIVGELRGYRASGEIATRETTGVLQRSLADVTLPSDISVSVVLPTIGRYPYLEEVLGDLRAQTIKPVQILICDGNPPEEREPAVYEKFRDLPIEVVEDELEGQCSSRNACMKRATGDYIWFVDDDSRFDADNLEAHLRMLFAYGADVSVGPATTKGRPELHAHQREVACTFMDCGTTLVKRHLIDQVGGFDLQFNTLLPNEDFDIGMRFVRAGGLMMSNPHAKRFHYHATIGGCRRAAHAPQRWKRFATTPRPPETVYYVAHRHFEPGVAFDAMFQGAARRGWLRKDGERATLEWRIKTLVGEIVALPLTAFRLYESYRKGKAMVEAGPRIPRVTAPQVSSGARTKPDRA